MTNYRYPGCRPLIKFAISGLAAIPVTLGIMELASFAKVGSWNVGVVARSWIRIKTHIVVVVRLPLAIAY